MTYTDKPVRQDVLGQSSQEIVNSNVGDFVLPTTSVILVIEGNMRVSDIQYPGICNGHTIGIASDVFKNLADSLCGRL